MGCHQGTSSWQNQRAKSVPLKLQAGETGPGEVSALRMEQPCLPLSLAFTEPAGHDVLLRGNKTPHSVERYPGARVSQPGAVGLWMGQSLRAMWVGRLEWRAKMSPAFTVSLGKRQ